MKKLLSISIFFALFTISCKKQVESVNDASLIPEAVLQQQPVCGMEEAMAAISPEMRSAIIGKNGAASALSGELLFFLDFDGAAVNPGFPRPQGDNSSIIRSRRICPAALLTQLQKDQIIEMVKDDFSPFNVRITTDQSDFNLYAPAFNKELCIITTVPQVIGFPPSIGGLAPLMGPGERSPFDPSFVFSQLYGGNLKEIANTISHEVAHTLGLGHQHLYSAQGCLYTNEYHPGFGTGLLSFSPLMGDGFGKRISNWWAQPCEEQNDFAMLNNQVELKEDDFPNVASGNSTVSGSEIVGVLEQPGDVDFIRINFKKPGAVIITSENIDIKASLYNPGGQLIGEYNDPNDTQVTIPSVNGMKYIKIEAVNNENMPAQFMTGKYKVNY